MPLVDVSGSMYASVGNTNLTALTVATSLGIYIAERNKGDFKDLFLTFSRDPQMVKLNGDSLFEKYTNMRGKIGVIIQI